VNQWQKGESRRFDNTSKVDFTMSNKLEVDFKLNITYFWRKGEMVERLRKLEHFVLHHLTETPEVERRAFAEVEGVGALTYTRPHHRPAPGGSGRRWSRGYSVMSIWWVQAS